LSLDRLRRALTEHSAETSVASPDRRLAGRTYAIPFDDVWTAALSLAAERPRWTVMRADDQRGVIEAEARTRVFGFVDDLTVRIGLDGNAQTRLDMTSTSRRAKGDLGTNARRIARFLQLLDRRLMAGPDQIITRVR